MSNLGANPGSNLGSNLGIDAERLWDSLMETARIGGTPDGGIARLTLSDDDRRVLAQMAANAERIRRG